VTKWFEKTAHELEGVPPTHIFNFDETAFQVPVPADLLYLPTLGIYRTGT